MKKVLITVPSLAKPGGVSALYNIIKINKIEEIDYFEVHGYSGSNKLFRFFDLIKVYFKFTFLLSQYDLIHVNPSLDKKCLIRDGLFVFLSKVFKKEVLVYWHGWDETFEGEIIKKSHLNALFSKTFLRADIHVVLGSIFANKLKRLGVQTEIIIESNAASDEYLSSSEAIVKNSSNKISPINILFIARIEREKGIFIVLDTFELLLFKGYNLILTIAGDGSAMDEVKDIIANKELKNVFLLGNVKGEQKHRIFSEADFMLFPTYHNEGMPISILEGMLYGLPIITRPVGGIIDWLENNVNGFYIDSLDPRHFAELSESLILNQELQSMMSINNIEKALKYFTPAAINSRLINYYESTNRK